MDRDAFDGLTKLLAPSPNRRAALGALLGTGLAGMMTAADAKQGRKNKRKGGKGGAAYLTAEAADCASPGPSSNISGCPFQDEDFTDDDLSGSKMVATNFRGAELVGTNLSSSNARNAIFREANLTCANLRSSTLGGANFTAADLTGANLKSSGGCNTASFNAATTFCRTTMCDGSVRNDDCAGGLPAGTCCVDDECPNNQTCNDRRCGCPAGWEMRSGGWCAHRCQGDADCAGGPNPGCGCFTSLGGSVCATFPRLDACINLRCPDGALCAGSGCFAFCGPATD